MRRLHLIKQHDEKDCGAACLAMILDYYGKQLPLAQVRAAIKVDQYGANVFGLVDGAASFQMRADALTGSPEDIWNAIAEGQVKMPAIVRIVNEQEYEHFIVIDSMKGSLLKVNDPGAGKLSMTKEQFLSCCLGQIITFLPDPDFVRENKKRGQLAKFTSLILSQKKLLVSVALLSLLVTGIGIAGSFVFRYIIDIGLHGVNGQSPSSAWVHGFGMTLLGLAVLYLFRSAFQMLRGLLLTKMSQNMDLSLMLGYYNHVADLPLDFFVTRKNGEITSRFEDAGKIRDALSGAALTIMIDLVMVLVCGFILFNESPLLFSVSLIMFGGFVLVTALFIRPLSKISRDTMEKSAQFSSYLKESIDGMETVKGSQAEASVKEKTGKLFRNFLSSSLHASVLSMSKDTIIEAISSAGSLVILWFGVSQILQGRMTLGTLITFNTLLSYFLSPVQNMVQLQDEIQEAVVAADRLSDILCLETEKKGGKKLSSKIGSISFDHVNFRYGNRDLVLKDMNFTVGAGEKVAFVGESGCGKSTTVKLLMGMYKPEEGSVLIDGTPVSSLDLESLRKQIAYVPQNTFLFSGSIRDNLLLGLPEDARPGDDRIVKVLQACCCDFVLRMPFGIDSPVEENGADLSGGQKQRLAIARAILRQPQLLILDEATSALDTVTECRIQKALDELLPDVTTIMVAHRLSTVKKCSKIFVVGDGTIKESGSHNDLISQPGIYARLWQRQAEAA